MFSAESAVLLDLLLSLPEELGYLDFKKLKSHMNKRYMELRARYTSEKSRPQAETNQPENNIEELHDTFLHVDPATSCLQQQEGGSSVAHSKDETTVPSAVDWKTLGICPLNSFMFPLDILARKSKELDWASWSLLLPDAYIELYISEHSRNYLRLRKVLND